MAVTLSRNIVVAAQAEDTSNNARLLIDNVFRRGTVTASSENGANNGWLENAIDGLTFDWWEPTALPATLSVELTEASPVDCGLIAVHDGLTYVFQYHDGSDWVNLHEIVASETTAVSMVIFDEVTALNFRIQITASEGDPVTLGVVMLGKSITLPRTFYGGHAPITLNRKTQIKPYITEGGFEKGIMTLRTGAASSVTVKHCPAAWVRENLENINNELRNKPFGFAWRPTSEPTDVAYCWLNKEITATNNGPGSRMDIQFDFEAYIGGFAITTVPVPIYVAVSLGATGEQTRLMSYDTVTQQATMLNYNAYNAADSGFENVLLTQEGSLIACGRQGLILRSDDQGETLSTKINEGVTFIHFYQAVQSSGGTIIVVGGNTTARRRVYRSTDDGANFAASLSTNESHIYSVATDDAGTWVGVAYNSKVMVSTDDGVTWAQLTEAQSGFSNFWTAVDWLTLYAGEEFVFIGGTANGRSLRVYTSSNGFSCVEQNNGLAIAIVQPVQAAFDDDYFYVSVVTASPGVYRLPRNFSGAWTKVLDPGVDTTDYPYGIRVYQGKVYAFAAKGLFVSDDSGDTWAQQNDFTGEFANSANVCRRAAQ